MVASTYLTSPVNDLPLQTLIGADFRLADNEGNKLDLGVLTVLARLADGTVSIVGEVLVVSGAHVGFGDQMEGFRHSEDFDCGFNKLVEAKHRTRDRYRAG